MDAKGTAQDYLTHPIAIPAEIMTRDRLFSGVVKAPSWNKTARPVLDLAPVRPDAAMRRRLDTDPATDQAHQSTGEGLFQPEVRT